MRKQGDTLVNFMWSAGQEKAMRSASSLLNQLNNKIFQSRGRSGAVLIRRIGPLGRIQ
jgi:hypothetical protein